MADGVFQQRRLQRSVNMALLTILWSFPDRPWQFTRDQIILGLNDCCNCTNTLRFYHGVCRVWGKSCFVCDTHWSLGSFDQVITAVANTRLMLMLFYYCSSRQWNHSPTHMFDQPVKITTDWLKTRGHYLWKCLWFLCLVKMSLLFVSIVWNSLMIFKHKIRADFIPCKRSLWF